MRVTLYVRGPTPLIHKLRCSHLRHMTAAMVPYFPDFAMKNFGASSTLVGMAFARKSSSPPCHHVPCPLSAPYLTLYHRSIAVYPLSLFITSLFAGALSTRSVAPSDPHAHRRNLPTSRKAYL